MLQIILIIMGIVYCVRRPRVARLTAADIPGVSPDLIESWKRLELKSIDWFLVASWGVSVMGTIFGTVLALAIPDSGMAITVVILAAFLAGLTVSAIYGSRSAQLKKQMMQQTSFRLP
jgi:uncharacterized membrane protein YfcA